jgi:hypothetical protein
MGILAFHFGKMLFTFFQPHGPAPLPLTRKISARQAAPAVKVAAPAPALAARVATAQAVPYVAVAAAASPATGLSATPASVASPRGNSGIRDAAVRRPPETVSYTAGPVDMSDVRVKIRKIVREGFNLSGSSCCSQWFRQGWFGRARMVLGRARFQPCRYRANKNAGFYPLRDASVST